MLMTLVSHRRQTLWSHISPVYFSTSLKSWFNIVHIKKLIYVYYCGTIMSSYWQNALVISSRIRFVVCVTDAVAMKSVIYLTHLVQFWNVWWKTEHFTWRISAQWTLWKNLNCPQDGNKREAGAATDGRIRCLTEVLIYKWISLITECWIHEGCEASMETD